VYYTQERNVETRAAGFYISGVFYHIVIHGLGFICFIDVDFTRRKYEHQRTHINKSLTLVCGN